MIGKLERFRLAPAARGRWVAVLVTCVLLGACVEEPLPRSFTEFMEDNLAREGVLVRCNADRVATANDPECVNARRAAAAIAAQAEAGQRERLDSQSEARRLAARRRADAQDAADRQAALIAAQEQQTAYESQWAERTTTLPAPGEPTEPVTPSATDETPSGSATPMLEPVELPSSIRQPLTTISLPSGVRPLEYPPPEPELEEIVLPDRHKTTD